MKRIPFILGFFLALGICASGAHAAYAATLSVSPATGVYSTGGTFSVSVILNTAGKPINAAEGSLSFDPHSISVVGVTKGSIFSLWTQDPTFSNSAGTISFGGGSPAGYTGSAGTIVSILFRASAAGTPKLTFTSGSVLAADGLGTNVLTGMTGGTYTINAAVKTPAAEPVYVPPANTPGKPTITSTTHPDPAGWYATTTAILSWKLPGDVTSIRTLLDDAPGTIPTKVYDVPVSTITIPELSQGVSYFHLQFKNTNGWGTVANYRLGVDTEKPAEFTITEASTTAAGNPSPELVFTVKDISPVTKYKIQIDGGDPIEYNDEKETHRYTLPVLPPGHHTVIVEAFDSAGNSTIATYALDIASFAKPIFTEYPTRLNTGVIPVFKGTTRPNAKVTITVSRGGTIEKHDITSDDKGVFTYIPDQSFDLGVYDMTAVAVDQYGASSDPSDPIRFIVEQPGYLKVGALVVSVLSIIVPLIALLVLLTFGTWYLWHRLRSWRRRIVKETKEAEHSLAVEFDQITANLSSQVAKLMKSRKGKLTKAESALIESMKTDIEAARNRIQKEISDIDDVVE